VPDADLVRTSAAARAAGHRWDAIAAARDNGPGKDIPAVIRQQNWISLGTGPEPQAVPVTLSYQESGHRDS
jgi:hypothetical protein